jgi:hypothetical protein
LLRTVSERVFRSVQYPPTERLDVFFGRRLVAKGPNVVPGDRIGDNRAVDEVSGVGVDLLMCDFVDYVDGDRRIVLSLDPPASATRAAECMGPTVLLDSADPIARLNADPVHLAPRSSVASRPIPSHRDCHNGDRPGADQKLPSAQASHASDSSRKNITIAAR